MEAFNHVVVVNIVGLVENHSKVVLNDVTIKLVDVVDRRVSRDRVAYVVRMFVECLAEDRPRFSYRGCGCGRARPGRAF